jgi:hypothetical protein
METHGDRWRFIEIATSFRGRTRNDGSEFVGLLEFVGFTEINGD